MSIEFCARIGGNGLRTHDAGPLNIECKNVRHWMYPHVEELSETLAKCIALDAVPVFIAPPNSFCDFHGALEMRICFPRNLQSGFPNGLCRFGR